MMKSNESDEAKLESDSLNRPELQEKLAEQEILRQSLEGAKLKEKELYDQLLRLKAEFENYRKRSEQRILDSRRNGKEEILLQLLVLSDTLIHSENTIKSATDMESVKEGLRLIHQQFEKFLKDQGLVAVKTVGEKLDPHRHEVIAQEVREDSEDGLILDEIQRGYTWQDRLVRPARVRVAVKPTPQQSDNNQEEQHG